jgi:ligand-binding SRPBCC domain-containing protein
VKVRQLKRELWLPQPVAEIFPFFGDAANLEVLTPPWLKFQILSPRPLKMHIGTLVDYRLRVRGLPMRWQSEITAWEPPHRFVDEQRRGPYRLWRHEHEFVERDGGTVIRDKVEYAIPFDLITHRLFVRPDIERIFAFLEQKMRKLFPARPAG